MAENGDSRGGGGLNPQHVRTHSPGQRTSHTGTFEFLIAEASLRSDEHADDGRVTQPLVDDSNAGLALRISQQQQVARPGQHLSERLHVGDFQQMGPAALAGMLDDLALEAVQFDRTGLDDAAFGAQGNECVGPELGQLTDEVIDASALRKRDGDLQPGTWGRLVQPLTDGRAQPPPHSRQPTAGEGAAPIEELGFVAVAHAQDATRVLGLIGVERQPPDRGRPIVR